MLQGVRFGSAAFGIVTVTVAEDPSPDAAPPLKVAPQSLEPDTWPPTLAGPNPTVTSKDTSTAALVGTGGVSDNVLRVKVAVTLWFDVTLLNEQVLPLGVPLQLVMLLNT